jgi:hypothetical protein
MNRTRPYLIALLACLAFALAHAQSWEPYAFKGDERFEYLIHGSDQGEVVYILDIRREGDEGGEARYRVSYTTESVVTASQLGADMAFGGAFGMGLNMAILNPMYMMFMGPMFADLDWEVGERMSLMGMGRITITGKETVAGREGFVVQFESGQGDERELAAEWVIDPEVALPLRSRTYERGEVVTEAVLRSYQRY